MSRKKFYKKILTNLLNWFRMPSMTKKYTMRELAEAIGVHPDTLYKAKRNGRASIRLATKREKLTGIPNYVWAYPLASPSYVWPWDIVLK